MRVICKPGFESARLAEQDIPAFMERQNFNIRPLKGIFDLEGRMIYKKKLPKKADAISISLKVAKSVRKAFERAKRETGWDLLTVNDWACDLDLKGINKYEDLLSLRPVVLKRLRRGRGRGRGRGGGRGGNKRKWGQGVVNEAETTSTADCGTETEHCPEASHQPDGHEPNDEPETNSGIGLEAGMSTVLVPGYVGKPKGLKQVLHERGLYKPDANGKYPTLAGMKVILGGILISSTKLVFLRRLWFSVAIFFSCPPSVTRKLQGVLLNICGDIQSNALDDCIIT